MKRWNKLDKNEKIISLNHRITELLLENQRLREKIVDLESDIEARNLGWGV